MLQPTDEIAVTLTATEWNQVLSVLGEGRFSVVAPLISKIMSQAQRSDGAALDAGDVSYVPN